MLILYDAVGTVTDAVGSALQNATYVEILVPVVLKRCSKLKYDDAGIVPLLQVIHRHVCGLRSRLTSVTTAMGPTFLPYAEPIFERCAMIVHTCLLQYQAYQQDRGMGESDRSVLVVALDLLSVLTRGFGTALEPLIMREQPSLPQRGEGVGVPRRCYRHRTLVQTNPAGITKVSGDDFSCRRAI